MHHPVSCKAGNFLQVELQKRLALTHTQAVWLVNFKCIMSLKGS
jgi:hypothetical protein